MKPSDFLEFTIRCEESDKIDFSEDDLKAMNKLSNCLLEIENLSIEDYILDHPKSCLVNAQGEIYDKIKEKLCADIRFSVEKKINAICQEIYNWIYEVQNDNLKEYMEQFDSKRTRYYFDNEMDLEDE
jgi:DNA-directed RNA polymerase subunit L